VARRGLAHYQHPRSNDNPGPPKSRGLKACALQGRSEIYARRTPIQSAGISSRSVYGIRTEMMSTEISKGTARRVNTRRSLCFRRSAQVASSRSLKCTSGACRLRHRRTPLLARPVNHGKSIDRDPATWPRDPSKQGRTPPRSERKSSVACPARVARV
jgi:hypothetical protein